jgi:hypothetical protein
MGFNFSLFFIHEELGQMSKYLDVVVSGLNTNLENISLRHELELEAETTNNEFSDDYVDWVLSKHQDELIEAGQDFPQLLMISFVILWYSFVEQHLLDFCEELDLAISVSAKNEENLGKGIKRAHKFLSRVRNYNIDQKHWQELLYISKLRNILVHEGRNIRLSYVKPDGESVVCKNENSLDLYVPIGKEFYEYMKKRDLFVISGMFFNITPSIDYCRGLVEFGGEIFRKLYSDLRSTKEQGEKS